MIKALEAPQPDAAAKLAALAQQSTDVEAHRTHTLAMCTSALTQLAATVTDANGAVDYIATLGLTEILAPLTAPLLKHRAVATPLLQISIVHLGQQIDTRLTASFMCTAAEQKQGITEICTAPSTDLVNAHLNLSGSITLVRPEVVDRFSCLSGMGTQALSTCTSLVGFYGKPWLETPRRAGAEEEIGQVLTHCQNTTILPALKKKVPAKSTVLELSKAVGILAWTDEDWTTVCAAINKLGYTEIPLPATVTAVTWIPIHQSWVPRAFCTASMETDLACLKHMKQETGTTPSANKLTLYFAELSNACVLACTQWRQAGKPGSIEVQVAQGVATWNIHVRNLYGKPQVFHVDSGYAKSPWVKRPN
ncbi:hypothetical protein ACU686_36405 [Yinghuangia aomiensis]